MGHQGENTVAAHSFLDALARTTNTSIITITRNMPSISTMINMVSWMVSWLILRRVRRNVVIGDTGNEIPAGPRDGRIHKLIAGIPKVNLGAAALSSLKSESTLSYSVLPWASGCKEFPHSWIFFKICKQIKGISQRLIQAWVRERIRPESVVII